MIVSILIGLSLILSTFISTVSIVQKIAYAQARMEPTISSSNSYIPHPNALSGIYNPHPNYWSPHPNSLQLQGYPNALSGIHTPQYPRTETSPSTTSQLSIPHAQGIGRDPEFGTQGAGITRDPEFAAVLSSDGRSITNGPQVLAQGTHSVDISKVLQKISIVAGVGFILASFFKFHQHKQNPQQVQLSQALLLLESIHLFS
jgi:hypothetical protein